MIDDGDRLYPVVTPMPIDMKILLSNENTKVEEILRLDVTYRLFRTSDPTISAFLASNVDKLLYLSFEATADPEMSAKAFAILEHSQSVITSAIIAKQRLHNTACQVLSSTEDIHTLYLNRLASLTMSAIYIDSGSVISSCGYITQLIQFVAEPSILSLFETLCTPSDENIDIQKWLVTLGFTEILQRELDDFPVTIEGANIMTPEANYFAALLRIVAICGSSPILGPKVCNYAFVTALNRTAGNYPQFVENQRWEAIAAIYCPATVETMRGFFPIAVEIISDQTKCVTRAGMAAIDLLSVMAQYDQVLTTFIISMEVPHIIINLMFSHPDSTFLHISALDFITMVLQNDPIRCTFLNKLIEVLLLTYKQPNKSLRGTLYTLQRNIMKLAKLNAKIATDLKRFQAFYEMIKGPTMNYKQFLKCQYGGPFRYAAEDDVQLLAAKTFTNIGL